MSSVEDNMKAFDYRGYSVHYYNGVEYHATWITSLFDNEELFSDDNNILPDEVCKRIIDSWFEDPRTIEQLRLF